MSRWFQDRRQEFLAATLRQFGQVRRTDLVRQFGITLAQASADIAEFLAATPARVTYDVSAKTYVLVEELPRIAEEDCPGHAASDGDPKVCAHCGVHIDSLRPPGEDE